MCLQVRDSGLQLPPAGHIFEKLRPSIFFDDFSEFVASQVGDSGLQLPPAGQNFEKSRPQLKQATKHTPAQAPAQVGGKISSEKQIEKACDDSEQKKTCLTALNHFS